MQLRDYQQACFDTIMSAYRCGQRMQLVTLPTGTGKTIVFIALAKIAQGRVLIVAHRNELIKQPHEKLVSAGVSPEDIGVVKAGRNELDRKYVLASVQTLARANRLEQVQPGDFSLLIIDEAHHAAADSYRRVIERVQARLTLGVTATPFRADGKPLDLFGAEPVFTYPLRQAIEDGWLVQPRQFLIRTDVDLAGVSTHAGDFAAGELSARVDCPSRNRLVFESWRAMGGLMRPTVIFAVTVDHAHAIADTFNDGGRRCEVLSAETPDDERAAIIERLRYNEIDAVANVGILTEGTDIPPLSCIVLARPTKSLGLYTQMVGRVLRPHHGKQDALILDVADNATRHKLVTVSTLLGVETEDFNGETLETVEQREREAKAITADREWNHWHAEEVEIIRPACLDDYKPSASWHDDQASSKQLRALDRYGVDLAGYSPTKGEAAFLMDRAREQRQFQPATGRQRWFLKQHGVNTTDLSIGRASEIINEIKSWQGACA